MLTLWHFWELQRQRLEYPEESDSDPEVNCEREEEKPQVIVLKPGDLTADEAEKEKQKLLKGSLTFPRCFSPISLFLAK